MPSIIIVFPKEEDGQKVRGWLRRKGLFVHTVCTSAAGALMAADRLEEGIVVCPYSLRDMTALQLMERLPDHYGMVCMSADGADDFEGSSFIRDGRVVRLTVPFRLSALLETLTDLEEKLFSGPAKKTGKKKRDALASWQIDRAKELLMQKNKMSEPEAYRYIQKTSMDSGVSMAETAQMLLDLMDM